MRLTRLPTNLLLIYVAVFLSPVLHLNCYSQEYKMNGAHLHTTSTSEVWVNQTLHQLTMEEEVGQMLQIDLFGDYQALTDPNYVYVRSEIQKYHIGSVALFARMFGPNLVKGNPVQVATIINQLQHDSKLPLLVGADVERGLASRLSDCPEFPFPMAFGAVGNPKLVEKFGATVGREARAVGIDWAYAGAPRLAFETWVCKH